MKFPKTHIRPVWMSYIRVAWQLFLFFALGLYHFDVYSQELPEPFKKTVDSLIEVGPKTYSEIDKAVRSVRKDTLFMRYFADGAGEKNHHAGQAYALNQLGRTYRDISEFSRSLALHLQAFEVAEKAENLEFEVYSLNMISVVFRKTDAIRLQSESLTIG